jgi:hypothetical protein
MKALIARAEWAPREGHTLTQGEEAGRIANVGSRAWKNPSFTLEDAPVPALAADEVLIRVRRCGVCGSDTHLYETDADGYIIFSGPTRLPCVIGHEYSGVVEKAGAGVTQFAAGDLVAVESVLWCGRCLACRSGSVNQCLHVELAGLTVDGAMSDYAKAKEWHCWSLNRLRDKFGDDTALDLGALIEPAGCAYNGMFIAGGGFLPGATVAVFGLGPIGLAAVALARSAGAAQVLGFDIIAERLAIAEKMGADAVYSFNSCDPAEIVLKRTGGRGADICVEAAGAGVATVPFMERALGVNGKIIYLGRAARTVAVDLNRMVTGASSIIGARGHAGHGIFDRITSLLVAGRINLGEMITSRVSFADCIEALRMSTTRKDGKILVVMDGHSPRP